MATFQRTKANNTECGDSYFYIETKTKFVCAIADGLGSGEFAKESSEIVINIIRDNMDESRESLINMINKQLIGKRGVVLGVLKICFKKQVYSFCSIGNIGIMINKKDKKRKRNLPSPGYLSGHQKNVRVMRGKLEPTMNFLMFSDGLLENELSQSYFLDTDVNNVIETFISLNDKTRKDDTTLIALRYDEEAIL